MLHVSYAGLFIPQGSLPAPLVHVIFVAASGPAAIIDHPRPGKRNPHHNDDLCAEGPAILENPWQNDRVHLHVHTIFREPKLKPVARESVSDRAVWKAAPKASQTAFLAQPFILFFL